jgi:hypothetical protein
MKKRYVALFLVGALLGSCVINYASVDRSAKDLGDGLNWQGKIWVSTGVFFPLPKAKTFLATDGDGGSIYGFGDDPDFTYLGRDSFLDNYLYVREGYKLKTSGTLTAIAMRQEVFPVTSEITKIRSILTQSLSNHYYCQFDDFRSVSSVWLSYNKSMVADFSFGNVTYDGEFWYFIPNTNGLSRNGTNTKIFDCYQIDKQHSEMFMGFKTLYGWHSSNPDLFVRALPVEL